MVVESENIGKVERATIYSDWHLSPSTLLGVAGTVLHSRKWSRSNNIPQLPFEDIFTQPDHSGSVIIAAGDFIHLNPLFPFQKDIAPDALSYFADALDKRKVNGEYFKLILGNHTDRKNFPNDVLSFLKEREILVPDGKLSFQSGNDDFYVIHGHEAQPGFFSLPFENYPKVEQFMNRTFDLYRRLHRSGDVSGQYPIPSFFKNLLNKPQKNWQKENLPEGTRLISGHTHVPEVTANYLNSGFWDMLFGYLSYGRVDEGKMSSRIREI